MISCAVQVFLPPCCCSRPTRTIMSTPGTSAYRLSYKWVLRVVPHKPLRSKPAVVESKRRAPCPRHASPRHSRLPPRKRAESPPRSLPRRRRSERILAVSSSCAAGEKCSFKCSCRDDRVTRCRRSAALRVEACVRLEAKKAGGTSSMKSSQEEEEIRKETRS